MKVGVIGAGNMGLAMAAVLSRENCVTLYSKKADDCSVSLALREGGVDSSCAPVGQTSSLEELSKKSEIIFCTYPAFLRRPLLDDLKPHLREGQLVGFVPGYGGIELGCQELTEHGVIVFGMQRVPYVARSQWSDRRAEILSKKERLYVAALPRERSGAVAALIGRLFGIATESLRQYLAITLAPSNPLLHTSGVYGLFGNSRCDEVFPGEIGFYEAWNDRTSRFLLSYDDELQGICRALDPLDLSEVVPLRTYYEAPTPQAMTKKLKSIESFKVVRAPLRKESGGFSIDLGDRMFIEDFPFGVAVIKGVGLLAGVRTPVVDELLAFYARLSGREYFSRDGTPGKDLLSSGAPQASGIASLEELVRFYGK